MKTRLVTSIIGVTLLVAAVGPTARAASGSMIWVRHRGSPSSSWVAVAVAVSPDGTRVFVTGQADTLFKPHDVVTIAYDAATGSTLWIQRYRAGIPEAIAVSPDGTSVFVAGSNGSSFGESDFLSIAYDASSGATEWLRTYDGPGHNADEAGSLAVAPSGSTVYVAGISEGTGSEDMATVAYDAVTGHTRWVKRYDGPGHNGDWANSIAVSPSGGSVFVTGGSVGRSGYAFYATVAYDATTGTKLWLQRYHALGGHFDAANAVVVSPDSRTVFVTGQAGSHNATIAYDASTGATSWIDGYQSGAGTPQILRHEAIAPDGSELFVTGSQVTAAYATSTGRALWVRSYPLGNGTASIGAAPDDKEVFVTGSVAKTTGSSFDTVAYDPASGATLWAQRYKVGLDNQASALAASPDSSSVVVTGASDASFDSLWTYLTVAYAA